MGSQHYQEALQGSQPPAMDVMQHMAHMQALLAGATSASLQVPLCSPHTIEKFCLLLATCSLYDITHVLSQNGNSVPHWDWPCRTPISARRSARAHTWTAPWERQLPPKLKCHMQVQDLQQACKQVGFAVAEEERLSYLWQILCGGTAQQALVDTILHASCHQAL